MRTTGSVGAVEVAVMSVGLGFGSDRGTVVNTSNGRGLTYFSDVD